MSLLVARKDVDICTGHDACPSRKAVEGSPDVFLDGHAVVRLGDKWESHGCSAHPPHQGQVTQGSAEVRVNGLPVARVGDPISCGGKVKTGCSALYAGGELSPETKLPGDQPGPEPPKPAEPAEPAIDWSNDKQKISKHFTVGEVTKGDPARRPVPGSQEEKNILALAKEMDKIRDDWGGPIGVSSWNRPPAVNSKIKGAAKNSQHINGGAADIYPINGQTKKFQSWLDSRWDGAMGYGAHKGFVHVDIRNGGGYQTGTTPGVRWNY